MKIFNLSLLVLAAILVSGCSQKQDDVIDTEPGTPAVLSVRLSSSGAVKATGAPDYSNESKIGKGIIFVFRGTGLNPVLDGKKEFDFGSGAVTAVDVNITNGSARHVYVVANHDNLAAFNNVTKLSDLYNVTNKYHLTSMRSGTNLAMSGSTSNITALNATNSAVVTLNFVGSRIHVDWEVPSGFVIINSVYLLNVKSTTDYFSAPGTYLTYNTKDYIRGKNDVSSFTTSQYFPTDVTSHTFDNEMQMSNLGDKGFTSNYFYVLENNTTAPTMVVLEGTKDGSTYYYPIIINGDQNGSGTGHATNPGDKSSVVARGMIYNVKAIINGYGNSSTDGPYTPLTRASINVTITPATWSTSLIDQEFN